MGQSCRKIAYKLSQRALLRSGRGPATSDGVMELGGHKQRAIQLEAGHLEAIGAGITQRIRLGRFSMYPLVVGVASTSLIRCDSGLMATMTPSRHTKKVPTM